MSEFLKPSERFRQEIEPAFADYLENPLSMRYANNLARAIDHQADWTYEYYARIDSSRLKGASDVKSFRRNLLVQCPQLQMMNDLSDAAHHRVLTRKNDPPRVVAVSTAAYSEQSGALHVPNYETPFLPEVTKAIEFWRDWPD
jgi:hypothetical protein